jgi:hypothetical protein
MTLIRARILSYLPVLEVVLGAVAIAGCGGGPTLPPAPDVPRILEAFGAPAGAALDPAGPRPPLQIYLDASGSMRGFLTLPQSRFRRALDQLLDRAVSGGYDVHVFRFDGEVSPLPASISTASLLSRDFFGAGETSFPTLFREIRKRRTPGSIAVVVTDLVQSGRTGEQRELSRAFQELAEDRPEVLLVAMRSAFVGRYWPEATPAADHLDFELRGADLRSSRPFYLLVLADRPEELHLLRRRLDLHVQPGSLAWELDASRPAMIVEGAEFSPRPQGPEATVWQVARRQVVLPPLGRSYRDVCWLLEREPPRPGGAAIRLRYRVDGEIAVEDLRHVAVDVRYCRLGAEGGCATAEPIRVPVEVLRPDASGEVVVALALPRPTAGAWDAYHVRLLPGAANLVQPFDADLWTTDDDAQLVNQTRTYKLDLFAETLTNALREPVALAEHFILLGRGD